MKDERKNIDELFSEGLGNFSPPPPPEMWEKIGAGLPAVNPAPATVSGSGRMLLIGIAAAVFTGIALLWYFSGNSITEMEPEVANQQNEASEIRTNPNNSTSDNTTDLSEEVSENQIITPDVVDVKNTKSVVTTINQTGKQATISKTIQKESIKNDIQTTDAILSESSTSTTQDEHPSSFSALRGDFYHWLEAKTVLLNNASATSAFEAKVKNSRKPTLLKHANIPLIGGIYAAWDLIDYGDNHTKQSRAIGLSLSTFKGPWLFETGAAISLSDDNGRFLINYSSLDSIGYFNKVVSFGPDPNNYGSIQFNTEIQGVFDSIDHAQEAKTANRYTYLQIPLMVGYNIYSSRLLTISLKAGPVFSMMLNSKEPGIAFSQKDANLQSIDQLNPGRVSTNWQIAAGLGIGLRLSQRLTLLAEPTYKTYLRPVYQGYKTKPQSAGIKAGLLYRF